jgi:type II secretory pathway component PulF
MPHFTYQALNANGESVSGGVEADNVQQAIIKLQEAGLDVHAIGVAPAAVKAEDSRRAAPARQQDVVRAHIEQVLGRAQFIVPALSAYAEEQPVGRQRRELRRVCRVLDRNDPTAATAALADLPEYWTPLLSAAASSNDPARVLNEFLDESQAAAELRRQSVNSLAYPLVIAALATAVLLALSIFVIPGFESIFRDFGLELPSLTLLTLAVAAAVTSLPVMIAILLGLGIATLVVLLPRAIPIPGAAQLADAWSRMWGRTPGAADFARYAAELLEAGVKLPDAVRIAAASTRRPMLRLAAADLASDLETGHPFGPSRYSEPLSATVALALEVPASAESRVRLLKEISACQSDRLRNRLSWSHGLLGPVAICVTGFLVGFIVLSLFLPLVDLINNLTG